MDEGLHLAHLLDSHRWLYFQQRTAAGLHLHVRLLVPGGVAHPGVPSRCPACQQPYPAVAAGATAVVLPLREGLQAAFQECACGAGGPHPPLAERARVARDLLDSFLGALGEGLAGGQHAVELATLRHLNTIILSLCQGEGNAIGQALDLLLSALVILLDAPASWLAYHDGAGAHLRTRGDGALVRRYLDTGEGAAVTAMVGSGGIHGRLGVLAPGDPARAQALVPRLAQECSLAFEVQHLFGLVQHQLGQVFGAMGSVVLLTDRTLRITYANPAAARLLGRPAGELVGSQAQGLAAPWTAALAARPPRRVQGYLAPMGAGSEGWVDWQVTPLPEGTGVAGWLILAEDRTDYCHWQAVARRAERAAVTASLVGALAHELRNPLAAARGLLQLMDRGWDRTQHRSYPDLVIRELDRITRLLNEFLLLGRPAEIRPEPLDLCAFVQELLPLLAGQAAGTGVEIVPDLEPVPPVAADPAQLTQALLNLVRNAVEAMGQQGRVLIGLRASGGWVRLTVRDTGPGLAPGVQEQLFRPFFSTKEKGTGLGLAVTQAIVHNHAGQISAENAPGGGAAFTIRLPAGAPRTDAAQAVDVLVAMADEAARYPAEHVLRAAGYWTVSARDLGEVLRLSQAYRPAVLLLDATLGAHNLAPIRQALPRARILVTGPAGSPPDYSRLVDQVRSLVHQEPVH